MYDFANSGYTTVVLTAVFSAYFVGVVAGDGADNSGTATLLWTVAMAITNILVLGLGMCNRAPNICAAMRSRPCRAR